MRRRRREKQPAVLGKQQGDDDDGIDFAVGAPLNAQHATLQAPVWDTTDDGLAGKQREYLESPVSADHEGTPTTVVGGADQISDSAIGRTSGATAVRQAKQQQPLLEPDNGKLNSDASLAVVVDGETLAELEKHPELLDRFLSLGTLCDAVVCSRVSPAQKALIVHNMRVRCEGGCDEQTRKKSRNPLANLLHHNNDDFMVTLAIGDGGNDIAMIQEAHVGIGIAGQEGLQASRAADFSIAQFRFLQKLLLVHGRWSYVRVSTFVMGTFYKCMAFYVTQLIFQFYTGFSGTSLFESWTLSMYNTLFSILPVLV
ncbi:drs2 neo1 protein, partial [Linderina pennispora]